MDTYIGMIALFGFNYAPLGWAFCDGSLLQISQNEALFSLIGTTYGGDGQSTFALPDLRGRVAIGQGQGAGLSNYAIGQTGGVESVNLTTQTMPAHNHFVNGTTEDGDTNKPAGAMPANSQTTDREFKVAPSQGSMVTMNAGMANATGSNQPFNITQPVLGANYCISLEGIYPSRP